MKKIDVAFYGGLVGWVFLLLGIIFNFAWSFFLGIAIFFAAWVVNYRYELYFVKFDDDTEESDGDSDLDSDSSDSDDSYGNES